MATYLLLRNNKKSGPYNLQDLVDFGLKPYDLVWIEGKSAAWRYPSEVNELKPYTQGVEEQPFDRFFKKNQETPKEEPVMAEPKTAVEQQPVYTETNPIEEKYEKYIPKKSVFVTLPGQKTVAVQKPVPSPKPAVPIPGEEMTEPVIKVTENPAAQIKYSQPLDEIKEMYVKTLQDRKNKRARKSFMIAYMKKASIVVGLVLAGVVTGLIINSGKGEKPISLQQSSSPAESLLPASQDPVTEPVREQPLQENQPAPEQIVAEDQPANTSVLQERETNRPDQQQQQSQPIVSRKQPVRNTVTPVNETAEQQQVVKAVPVQTDPVTGERSRTVRTEDNTEYKAVMPKKTSNGALENMVSVTSNNYQKVAFGGIRNLELTVKNESKFILDKVIVELQYLKPSEEPLRTELIQFNTVSPNGSMTVKIRDTNRGIKVAYKIVDIQSAQTETAMTGF